MVVVALALPACAQTVSGGATAGASSSADQQSPKTLTSETGVARIRAGLPAIEGAALEARIEQASAYPLGSQKNPVRAQMPQGQRAYLSRLRCSDLSRPTFYREGNAGLGVFGNIIDAYEVTCENAEPAKARIFMDMYHPGHIEREAVEGFGIVGGREGE